MRSGEESSNLVQGIAPSPTLGPALTPAMSPTMSPAMPGAEHCSFASPEVVDNPVAISSACSGEISSILASNSLAEALAQVKGELLRLQESSQIKNEFDVARFVARAEETYGLLLADELVQSPELRKIMAELIEI